MKGGAQTWATRIVSPNKNIMPRRSTAKILQELNVRHSRITNFELLCLSIHILLEAFATNNCNYKSGSLLKSNRLSLLIKLKVIASP